MFGRARKGPGKTAGLLFTSKAVDHFAAAAVCAGSSWAISRALTALPKETTSTMKLSDLPPAERKKAIDDIRRQMREQGMPESDIEPMLKKLDDE